MAPTYGPAFTLSLPLRHHRHRHRHRHLRLTPSHPVATATPPNTPSPRIPSLRSPLPRFHDFTSKPASALRLTHCRILSESLANLLHQQLRARRTTLSEVASSLSDCVSTRHHGGDTGWQTLPLPPSSASEIPPLNPEFLDHVLNTRPNALTLVHLSYGFELFILTDIRYQILPTTLGRSRAPGVPLSGRMRRQLPPPHTIPKSFHVQTLGCQMNVSDSERLTASLQAAGYTPVPDPQHASVYILNTCALREHAQQKVYSLLGPHAQRKTRAPTDITLVVAGCVAQQEGDAILSAIPEVDIVVGPQYANRFSEVLADFKQRQMQIVAIDPTHISEDLAPARRDSRVSAWVNIIYGCLERCSYCVVPNTRGLEQSRQMDAVREEVESVVRQGFKEVVLLGQNVDAYGRDLSPKATLADLLRHIHDVPGLERIRFTTGHPRYISDKLIEAVSDLPKVMEHFHIPPQSGDSRVLREMGRGYTRERYLRIVERIRERLPDASICSDMIVGFPGESEEAFRNSVSLADEVVFDANMVRSYSARPNTDAALRTDQVSEDEKKRRLDIMNAKMKEHALKRSERFIGREVEVLVEGRNKKVAGEMMGRERSNRVVLFSGGDELVGRIVYVVVDEAFTFTLRGRVVRHK